MTEEILKLTGARQIKTATNRIRLLFAALARSEALATLSSIGSVLGVKASGVNDLIKRADELKRLDTTFAAMIEETLLRIRNCKL